ncbi:MAG: serine/threonine-protein kinase [Myxococcota bacterium]
MSALMMETIDADSDAPASDPETALRTGGPRESFDERFRRSTMRAQIFGGGAAPQLSIGRYRIERRIGAGAMGTVYLGVDQGLERNVAVKVLRQEDAVHRARMQVEAKALAKLSHPNVVTVHEVGEEDGELFVAMEYIPGKTLTEWLREGRTLPEVLWMFDQAAAGLAAAHDAGVVHRDFKPDNVLVGDDGRVRVVDFGMACSPAAPLTEAVADPDQAVAQNEVTITRTGVLAGTPAYMSPEQFLGGKVDPRADQFAFCVALYEAVWGVRPFAGDTLAALARAVMRGEANLEQGRGRMDSVEADRVRPILARGLAQDPNDRFASMAALLHELRPRPANEPGPRRTRAVWFWAALALGTFTLLMFAGGVAAFYVLAADGGDAAASQLSCPPGTYEDGDRCSDIEYDPELLACDDAGCRVPRWVATRVIEDPGFRSNFGRTVPMRADGKVIGFKIFGVREHKMSELMGFEAGDLLKTVNGRDVAEHGAALTEEIVAGQGDQLLEIVVERDGAPVTRTLVVTDAL